MKNRAGQQHKRRIPVSCTRERAPAYGPAHARSTPKGGASGGGWPEAGARQQAAWQDALGSSPDFATF